MEVDNEGEIRNKKQRAKSLSRDAGNLAFYSELSISSMIEKQQYDALKSIF